MYASFLSPSDRARDEANTCLVNVKYSTGSFLYNNAQSDRGCPHAYGAILFVVMWIQQQELQTAVLEIGAAVVVVGALFGALALHRGWR